MKKEPAKYEYLLHAWGGFWNPWNVEVHGLPDTQYYWFDSPIALGLFRDKLEKWSKQLRGNGRTDAMVVFREYEGYLTRMHVTIRSLVLLDGQIHTVDNPIGYGACSPESETNQRFEELYYLMEYKWDICLPEELEDKDLVLLKTFLVLEHFNDRNKKP
jgi:hypothetical protein